jgi:hypothetical protein
MTLTTINLAALGQTINLTSEVTGTLPTANGGTNSTATTFVNAATNVTGALPIVNGGTGGTSYDPGKILQVVSSGTTTDTASSSTTYANTNLSLAITPSATSSKIIVIVNQVALLKNSSDNGGKIQLMRDSTVLNMFENDFGRDGGTGLNIVGGTGTSYLDSPNTTSAVTYKTQFACSVSSSASVGVQHNGARSSITLMEVGI